MNGPRKPAIWADAMRLTVEIEVAVRGFSRYHKYTLGADLRRQAAQVCRWVAQAVRFPSSVCARWRRW